MHGSPPKPDHTITLATHQLPSNTIHTMQEPKLFMIIERYRNGDSLPVYRRFREQGRLASEGLEYVNSLVTTDLGTCYQVMRTHDRSLLDAWIANWEDLVEFEVIPVVTSAEAAAMALAKENEHNRG